MQGIIFADGVGSESAPVWRSSTVYNLQQYERESGNHYCRWDEDRSNRNRRDSDSHGGPKPYTTRRLACARNRWKSHVGIKNGRCRIYG